MITGARFMARVPGDSQGTTYSSTTIDEVRSLIGGLADERDRGSPVSH